jgi:pimeloyl-ACP methyl ester carboxylesterase
MATESAPFRAGGSHVDTVRMRLATGAEVEARVDVDATHPGRPRCLLLHGNPGSLSDWERVLPRLAGVADTLTLDLPGFGRSPRPGPEPESLSLERLAEHAVAAADALSWREPFFIVGHSHGGGVALAAAALFPRRVAGLVLVGTLGAPAHASYRLLALPGATAAARLAGRLLGTERLRPVNHAVLRGAMRDIFWPEPVPMDKLERELAVLASRPEILVSMVQVALGRPSERLLDFAPTLRCPTLFVHGTEDALVPAQCAKTIHERIVKAGGRSEFESIAGAGHMLIHYQAPDIANAILRLIRAK